MAKTVKAKIGDSLCNIAHLNGFGDCQPLRAEAANAYIMNRAEDPGQLLPGDVVTIPEHVEKSVKGATEQKHKFVKRDNYAILRFVHGSATSKVRHDRTLKFLNVSNYITDKAGVPDGGSAMPNSSVRNFNSDADKDPDTFKVEVLDIDATGDLTVELEVLRPVYDAAGTVTGHTRFPSSIRGFRLLTATASKQGSSNRFRTCYLRLVTDAADKAAANDQTLLASDIYDPADADAKRVEILDQQVKASYTIASCPQNPKCKSTVILPIGTDRRRMRIAVHILRQSAGGAPVVSVDDAEKRILTWLRRSYAQMSIAPQLMQPVREVDPPENLVSISNDSGLKAAGPGTGGNGQISFRINAAGQAPQTITVTTKAGDKPITTARALAAKIAAPFAAQVSENPARFNDVTSRKSADIVITEAGGARVTIDNVVGNDTRQTISVGRPNTLLFQEWDGNNWLVGSIEQRAVLKNYDTGDDRFDLFIVDRFVSANLLGAAMMSGHIVSPNRRAVTKVKWSAFVDRRSSDASDQFPIVIAHEAMHAVGEVMHAQGAPAQVMHPTADLNNAVGIAKRVRDGAVTYDGGSIAGNHNLVRRMRTQGAPLLTGW
jgi:hypothetical protein